MTSEYVLTGDEPAIDKANSTDLNSTTLIEDDDDLEEPSKWTSLSGIVLYITTILGAIIYVAMMIFYLYREIKQCGLEVKLVEDDGEIVESGSPT